MIFLYVAGALAALLVGFFLTLAVMAAAVGLFLNACEWLDDHLTDL